MNLQLLAGFLLGMAVMSTHDIAPHIDEWVNKLSGPRHELVWITANTMCRTMFKVSERREVTYDDCDYITTMVTKVMLENE